MTKDLSNLRQIGAATQLYMNDNNGVFPGSATVTWMSQLNPKYLSSWRVLESPFDKRLTSELVTDNPAVSYGINASVYDANNAAMSADKVTKPVTFIVFAPAQASGPTISFQGAAAAPGPPGVTVNTGGTPATSNPGGTAVGGLHNNRAKINALCADWHAETMLWSGTSPAFTNNTAISTDTDGDHRWNP